MAAGATSQIIRAPGRLVVAPTDDPGDSTTSYPYGGTEVGKVTECSLTRVGNPAFLVQYEALGGIGDVLEPDDQWIFACFLRGWDKDAIAQFFSGSYAAGDQTQHAVLSAPGTSSVPGSSALGRGLFVAFFPDDEIHVPGVFLYRAIANWTEDSEAAFRRADEFGIPLTFILAPDTSARIHKVGRVADLPL